MEKSIGFEFITMCNSMCKAMHACTSCNNRGNACVTMVQILCVDCHTGIKSELYVCETLHFKRYK